MSDLNRSPKLRLQAALFDLIDYTSTDSPDEYGIREIWSELDTGAQEQIWSFLSSAQKSAIRTALVNNPEEPIF